MAEISRALNRPPSWPTKFFGSELGAQVICDDRSNRYIVNGAHETGRLQELLYLFISKYVLCGNCSNPETDLVLDDSSLIYSICKACGEKRLVDNRHRIATFIQKAVPTLKAFKAGQHASATSTNVHENDDSLELSISLDSSLNINTSDNDESKEQRTDPYELLGHYLSTHQNLTAKEVFSKIKELGLKIHYSIAVFIQVIFDNVDSDKSFLKILNKNMTILKELTLNTKSQKNLLNGLERVLVNFTSTDPIFKKVPIYLQKLYHGDIIEEEAIMEWAERPSKTFVTDKEKSKLLRIAATPFIDWLRSAEEDSDE